MASFEIGTGPRATSAINSAAMEGNSLWELRKYVLLQATLAASVTYSAGLSPPGGFWPWASVTYSAGLSPPGGFWPWPWASIWAVPGNPVPGNPVLQVTHVRRYLIFFYFNATAFVASIVTMSLILLPSLSLQLWWLRSLQAAMILSQLCLMGAYAAGSCRKLTMSAYVIALVCALLLFFVLCSSRRRDTSRKMTPTTMERSRQHQYLLIFTTLVTTVAYQAGLSMPAMFLSDSIVIGDPKLHGRFLVFFYFNTTAFVASLVITMLLMSRTATRHGFQSSAQWVCTAAALIGLTGAFAVGSSRNIKTSIYVVALVPTYIGLQLLAFFFMPVENWVHSVQKTLQKWLRLDQIELQGHRVHAVPDPRLIDADQLLQKSRMHLFLLGILAASVTYQAGLNPPGGFWQEDATDGVHHYRAGDPILDFIHPRRYMVFFFCNATAFVASLVILILLLSNIFSTQGIKYYALQVSMIMDLLGLIGAYAAGSCSQVSKSVYISVVVIPVFLYVGIHVMVRDRLEQTVPDTEKDEDAKRKLEKSRKLLLLLAILAASLTYQAGMSPPGGFWQGNPVLNNYFPRRYWVFFYCNATAFVASLAIIMLMVNRKLSTRGIQSHALRVCVTLDLIGLMGAFAAGCSRTLSTSIYVLILVFAALFCIVLQVIIVMSESVQGLLQRLLTLFGIMEEEAAGILPHVTTNGETRDPWYEKMPKYLLLLAALAVSVTYQAAMNPPGGLWDDSQINHIAGDPVLWTSHPHRYNAFFYCNATSFMMSLVIIVLLLINQVRRAKPAMLSLHTAMILDLFALMGAYAAGSGRGERTSFYILALMMGISACIVVLIILSIVVAKWLVERVIWCFSLEDL